MPFWESEPGRRHDDVMYKPTIFVYNADTKEPTACGHPPGEEGLLGMRAKQVAVCPILKGGQEPAEGGHARFGAGTRMSPRGGTRRASARGVHCFMGLRLAAQAASLEPAWVGATHDYPCLKIGAKCSDRDGKIEGHFHWLGRTSLGKGCAREVSGSRLRRFGVMRGIVRAPASWSAVWRSVAALLNLSHRSKIRDLVPSFGEARPLEP